MLLISLFFFVIMPVHGDQINLITGINRVFFSIISCIIVFSFWKLNIKIPDFLRILLKSIGEATYSVYLLHPIILNLFIYLF